MSEKVYTKAQIVRKLKRMRRQADKDTVFYANHREHFIGKSVALDQAIAAFQKGKSQ